MDRSHLLHGLKPVLNCYSKTPLFLNVKDAMHLSFSTDSTRGCLRIVLLTNTLLQLRFVTFKTNLEIELSNLQMKKWGTYLAYEAICREKILCRTDNIF